MFVEIVSSHYIRPHRGRTSLLHSFLQTFERFAFISFTRDKNIVTTAVDGSDSVVVESFGAKPWKITIEGILVDMDEHHYPQKQLRKFREMFEVNAMFDVLDCDLLDDLGVSSLYIEKIESFGLMVKNEDKIFYN